MKVLARKISPLANFLAVANFFPDNLFVVNFFPAANFLHAQILNIERKRFQLFCESIYSGKIIFHRDFQKFVRGKIVRAHNLSRIFEKSNKVIEVAENFSTVGQTFDGEKVSEE